MTLSYEELKTILVSHFSLKGSAFLDEPLYVSFRVDNVKHQVDDTVTYLTADGHTIAIDVDKQEELLGIEFL